jgi:hypothetical protein
MSGEISLLSAILWAVASGLIGVGIGVAFMCLFVISGEADDKGTKPPSIKPCAYLSDLVKGRSAKENMK